MKTIAEALAETIALFSPLASEDVAIEGALGRFLVDDVRAHVEVPPFDASLVDGYAVRAAAITVGTTLPVVGESRAGAAMPGALAAAAVMRVFTGAPVPEGADAVVMQEVVVREGGGARFEREVRVGAAIRRRGSDVALDGLLLPAGHAIDPGAIALLAGDGRPQARVHACPRVAIVTTGDELLAPGEPLRPGAIYDSNGSMLRALVETAGGGVTAIERARDDLGDTVRACERALVAADVVITAGGVSVGDHDLVHDALAALGVERRLWKVRMKPGKPLAVGVKDGVPVIGLPGNPVSAWVGFEVFVRPGLRRMLGDPRPYRRVVDVTLGASVRCSPDRTELARARLDDAGLAWPMAKQGSSALASVASVDALLVLPEREGELAAGERVRAMLLDGRGSAQPPFA